VQIIVIPGRLAKARSLTVSVRHVLASIVIGMSVLLGLALALYWISLRFAVDIKIPLLHQLVLAAQDGEAERTREYMQQNLNAMAVKLGEMQAQLTRLDALGERLSALAGVKIQDLRLQDAPGLGGAAASFVLPHDLSMTEFGRRLNELSGGMEQRADVLGVVEARLFDQAVRKKLLPTMMPVDAPFNASGFGWRIDPFTGQQAMHEGIDFIADVGTPVVAAAGGVVRFAGPHPQYGNMIDVDHGNDLTTRYAHLSRVLVKEGEVIQRGRHIADSGSSGRSTGPHLHFEVRFRGVAQNPTRFLLAGRSGPQLVAAEPAPAARR
jgi:murein DD-endopeptidase MepM/ murein hydrolase activator NlpD